MRKDRLKDMMARKKKGHYHCPHSRRRPIQVPLPANDRRTLPATPYGTREATEPARNGADKAPGPRSASSAHPPLSPSSEVDPNVFSTKNQGFRMPSPRVATRESFWQPVLSPDPDGLGPLEPVSPSPNGASGKNVGKFPDSPPKDNGNKRRAAPPRGRGDGDDDATHNPRKRQRRRPTLLPREVERQHPVLLLPPRRQVFGPLHGIRMPCSGARLHRPLLRDEVRERHAAAAAGRGNYGPPARGPAKSSPSRA